MSKNYEREEGFSLLELVLGMSIIITLTAGGSVGLLSINDGQRQEATDLAARTVMTTAKEYAMDFDDFSAPEHAAAEWYKEFGQAPVEVSVVEQDDCIAVFATHTKGNEAEEMTGDGCANISKPAFSVPEMPERPAAAPRPNPAPQPEEPIEQPEPEEVIPEDESQIPSAPDEAPFIPLNISIWWQGSASDGVISLIKDEEIVETKEVPATDASTNELLGFLIGSPSDHATGYFIRVSSSAGTFEYPVNAYYTDKYGTDGAFVSDITITDGELEKWSIDR